MSNDEVKSSDGIKLFFKKLLLIFGLIAVFASVIQQDFNQISDSLASSQATVVQLDKDNSRDHVDGAVETAFFCDQDSESSTVYFFSSVSYQEPTLLLHLRPPNA